MMAMLRERKGYREKIMGRDNTPEMITLTHRGIRRMETDEESAASPEGRATP
ncbi:hypothetical protein AB0F45_03700 [Streptomyces achromogenes]|uniref:hypothetical protein n=1 Tax=Streptomyces achromogenes TaxID=67255 RepID=UPI0033EF66F8